MKQIGIFLLSSVLVISLAGMDVDTESLQNQKTEELFRAVEFGIEYNVIDLLKSVDPNVTNAEKNTPLHCAVQRGHPGCVTLLLEQGASVDVQNSDGDTPLICAIKMKDEESCTQLLAHKANVTIANKNGLTPLHVAAEIDGIVFVKKLIAHQARIDARDVSGDSPLHRAAKNGHYTCLEELILNKANPNAVNELGATPLHFAVSGGNVSCLELLVQSGADRYIKDKQGNDAFDYASEDDRETCKQVLEQFTEHCAYFAELCASLREGIEKGYVEGVKGYLEIAIKMLKQHNLFEVKDDQARTPLVYAAQSGSLKIVRFILTDCKDFDLNAKDASGGTPLLYAADANSNEIVQLLIKRGADPKAVDSKKRTLMHRAAEAGAVDVLKGCEHLQDLVEMECAQGNTPLHSACLSGNLRCVNALLDTEADIMVRNKFGQTPLLAASLRPNNSEILRALLAEKADPNDCDKSLSSTLHICASSGFVENFNVLLSNKTAIELKPDIKLRNKFGQSPLLAASLRPNNSEILRALLAEKADPSDCDENLNTALHICAGSGFVENIDALLSDKIGMELKDKSGATALHLAVKQGHLAAVRALLRAGAEALVSDAQGITLLDSVLMSNDIDLLKVLLEYGYRLCDMTDQVLEKSQSWSSGVSGSKERAPLLTRKKGSEPKNGLGAKLIVTDVAAELLRQVNEGKAISSESQNLLAPNVAAQLERLLTDALTKGRASKSVQEFAACIYLKEKLMPHIRVGLENVGTPKDTIS